MSLAKRVAALAALLTVTTIAWSDALPPPFIGGVAPGPIPAGALYDFTPAVITPPNPRFTVENLPRWAWFDPDSGRILGVPTVADANTLTVTRITVHTPTQSSTMAITIGVMPPSAVTDSTPVRSVLRWVPPITDVNGGPLPNLAGYRIYVGASPSDLRVYKDVSDPTAHSAELVLPARIRFFSMTALTSDDIESNRTPIVAR